MDMREQRRGYGEYEMKNVCGFNSLSCYPDYISDKNKSINMEGWRNIEDNDERISAICKEIMEKLVERGVSDE